MRYFPDPISAWAFLAVLFALLGVASYTDQRWMTVPKWLSLPALALGVLISVLRGAYLGASGGTVWLLGPGMLPGAADGLLFAGAGFAVGFLFFFLLWLMGFAGGGDVKLFAALGAWIGPWLVVGVVVSSIAVLWVVVAGMLVVRAVKGKRLARAGRGRAGESSKLIVRFSLIVALAAVPVLLWALRRDLGIAPSLADNTAAEVRTHAR